jgi:hypothetical protein
MAVTSGIGMCDMYVFHCPPLQISVNDPPLCISTNYYTYIVLSSLTLSLLISYMYGAPCKARNFNVVYIWPTFGNAESRLFLFVAQCCNIESVQKFILCHSCV